MSKNAAKLGTRFFSTALNQGGIKIPTTIGRYQIVHKGHQKVYDDLLQNSSSPSPLPPALIMIGSADYKALEKDPKKLLKNPFNFLQRAQMIQSVLPEMPQGDPYENPSFLPYIGTYNNTTPPSLERMAEQLKTHCKKYNLPIEYIVPVISVKHDDRQTFQIYGKIYENSHQMSVLAKGLGLAHIEFDVVSQNAIHASDIRKDFAQNFHQLDPRITRFVQLELMKANLNNRAIGEDANSDRYLDCEDALKNLMEEGKMLALDGITPKIIDIPLERRALLAHHMGKNYKIGAKDKNRTTEVYVERKIPQQLSDSFSHVLISETNLIKETLLKNRDSVVIGQGKKPMAIEPQISGATAGYKITLSSAEKKFLNELNRKKDAKFAHDLREAIEIKTIDIHAKNAAGESLLELAVKSGLVQTAKMLLEKGVDFPVMTRGPQNSPLFLSAKSGENLATVYEDAAELGNILTEHSYKISTQNKSIAAPKNEVVADFAAKKTELLSQNIFASNLLPSDAATRAEFCKRIVDGAEVKKSSAIFLTDGTPTHYLKKSKCVGVETKFGSDLFNLLAKQHYEAKRELLVAEPNGKISLLIEFDPYLSSESFLNRAAKSVPNFDISLPQNTEFLLNYSRMCGVMHVLGEPDRNLENFLVNEQSGKPVKIDNGFLVNYQKYPFGDIYESGHAESRNVDYPLNKVTYDVTPHDRFKIYGSAQSRDFLICLLAGEKYENMQALIDVAKVKFGENETTENLSILAQSYIDAYNNGLDDELFERIKHNISKPENKHLEAAFMSFMSGINDTINLAKDEEFLNAYSSKYQIEGGASSVGILAKQCERFFVENAKTAQQQFSKLLQHFDELKMTPEYANYQENKNGIAVLSSSSLQNEMFRRL